jgi:hypothetical protein
VYQEAELELRGAEMYRRKPVDDPRLKALRAEVDKSNTVPIQTVLKDLFGIYVPGGLDRSWKTTCPFGFEHPDGGVERNMRVYGSNSAYCFAMHGFLTPVRLVQLRNEVTQRRAARILAEQYGLAKREPYWVRMQQLVLDQATKVQEAGSPTHAVAALQAALERHESYTMRQFDPDVTQAMEVELERLDEVLRAREEGGVRAWFREALTRMSRIL